MTFAKGWRKLIIYRALLTNHEQLTRCLHAGPSNGRDDWIFVVYFCVFSTILAKFSMKNIKSAKCHAKRQGEFILTA